MADWLTHLKAKGRTFIKEDGLTKTNALIHASIALRSQNRLELDLNAIFESLKANYFTEDKGWVHAPMGVLQTEINFNPNTNEQSGKYNNSITGYVFQRVEIEKPIETFFFNVQNFFEVKYITYEYQSSKAFIERALEIHRTLAELKPEIRLDLAVIQWIDLLEWDIQTKIPPKDKIFVFGEMLPQSYADERLLAWRFQSLGYYDLSGQSEINAINESKINFGPSPNQSAYQIYFDDALLVSLSNGQTYSDVVNEIPDLVKNGREHNRNNMKLIFSESVLNHIGL